jgi:beta-glucosidase
VAWQTVPLARGEIRTITVTLDPLCLSVFNTGKNDWEVLPGEYRLYAGGSSRNTPLSASVRIPAR